MRKNKRKSILDYYGTVEFTVDAEDSITWLRSILQQLVDVGITKGVCMKACQYEAPTDANAALMGLCYLTLAECTWNEAETEDCITWISSFPALTNRLMVEFKHPRAVRKTNLIARVEKPAVASEEEITDQQLKDLQATIQKVVTLSGIPNREMVLRRALELYALSLESKL